MSSKSFRARASAALRRSGNVASRSSKIKAEAAVPSWKIETLEPRLLMSADLAPGVHSLEGAIDQPGEQDRFEFVVTEKTRFLFDGVQGDQIQWQLKGGKATGQFDYRSLTATGDRFLDLDAGTYSLTVDGLKDKTGAYAFRLMGVDRQRDHQQCAELAGRRARSRAARCRQLRSACRGWAMCPIPCRAQSTCWSRAARPSASM